MKKYAFFQNIFNWITIIIWGIAIWGFWGNYNSIVDQYITVFLSLGLIVQGVTYLEWKRFYRKKEFYYVFTLLIISLICLILNHSGIGSFLLILNLCAIWFLSDRWHWTKLQIAVFSVFLFVIFLKRLISPQFKLYNSNVIGTMSFLIIFSLLTSCEFLIKKRLYINMLQILLIGLCSYLMIQSRCRTGLLVIIFWCILHYGVPLKWKKYPLFYFASYWIIQAMTIFFVITYTVSSFIFSDRCIFFNKKIFSGREKIWYELWMAYKQHFFIGCGSNIILPTYGNFNAHNSLFNILAVFGLFSCILLLLYIGYKIWKLTYQNKSLLALCTFDFIIALYVESIFETTLLWAPVVLLWVFPLIVLNSREHFVSHVPVVSTFKEQSFTDIPSAVCESGD